jgi:hypothetical protein
VQATHGKPESRATGAVTDRCRCSSENGV